MGPGPASGISKLNMLRPHGPVKSGMAAGCAAAMGASTDETVSPAIRLPNGMFCVPLATGPALPSRTPGHAAGSEVRRLGLRDRGNIISEEVVIVLGADLFEHRTLRAARPALDAGPGLVEGTWIIDG